MRLIKKKKKSNKCKFEYNSLSGDIRLCKISLRKAEEIIKTFENKWIYIKYISNVYMDKDSSNSGIYTKFKVRNIIINSSSILIYGFEDTDRLLFSKSTLLQTERSYDSDEIKLILKDKNILIEIYIQMYLPNIDTRLREIENSKNHLIITEGKTDWKHLKNALVKLKGAGKYEQLDINFFEYEEDVKMGNDTLSRICSYQSLFENEKLKIFIFDSDDKKINDEHQGSKYINHGNNVYSLVLPLPKHRKNTPLISIENYYEDNEIKIEDEAKRRLYLANEFDFTTGRHSICSDVYTPVVNNKFEPNHVIDNKVFRILGQITEKQDIMKNENKINIALSKNRFATNILKGIKPYDKISVEPFELIFDVIDSIFDNYYNQMNKKHKEIEEISPGVYLEVQDNSFEVLSIHGGCSKKVASQIRDTTMMSLEMQLSNDKKDIVISISTESTKIEIPIHISGKLLNFFDKKRQNNFNRIELHLCDEDKNYISHKEILKDDISVVLIHKLFEEYSR